MPQFFQLYRHSPEAFYTGNYTQSMNYPAVITLGEALIDMISTEKGVGLEKSPGFHRRPGGAPANVAVGLTRLGTEAGFIGKVGDDHFGHYLKSFLDKSGVNTSGLKISSRAQTTLAFVARNKVGDRSFAFFRKPGADELLQPEEVDPDFVQGGDLLHFGSLSLTHDSARGATFKAIQYAREAGNTVSFDPNIRRSLWSSERELRVTCREAVGESDLLKLSEEEALFITKEEDYSLAGEKLKQLGPEIVVITRGGNSSYFLTDRSEGHIESISVEPQDTTGAGDAFTAGLLAGLGQRGQLSELKELEFPELKTTLRFATASAGITTTEVGATEAFPHSNQVKELMQKRY